MGGPDGSRKWALKRNLPALIHAKDILKLQERGEIVRADINGEVRIYAESFRRCPEMIAIREALMSNDKLTDGGPVSTDCK